MLVLEARKAVGGDGCKATAASASGDEDKASKAWPRMAECWDGGRNWSISVVDGRQRQCVSEGEQVRRGRCHGEVQTPRMPPSDGGAHRHRGRVLVLLAVMLGDVVRAARLRVRVRGCGRRRGGAQDTRHDERRGRRAAGGRVMGWTDRANEGEEMDAGCHSAFLHSCADGARGRAQLASPGRPGGPSRRPCSRDCSRRAAKTSERRLRKFPPRAPRPAGRPSSAASGLSWRRGGLQPLTPRPLPP